MYYVEFNREKKVFSLYYKGSLIKKSPSKAKLFNSLVKVAHTYLKIFTNKYCFSFYGIFVVMDYYKFVDINKLTYRTNNNYYHLKILCKITIKNYNIFIYNTKINYCDFIDSPIHNKITLNYKDNNGFGIDKAIRFSYFDKDLCKYKMSKLKIINESNTTIYVRQSGLNKVFITNRKINISDYTWYRFKIALSYYISSFISKNIKLLYEKESYKYEESASVLYEVLVDFGYSDIYYVIDKKSSHLERIEEKYRKNLLFKNSLKHYVYFFRTISFIGTEVPAHAVDLRVANKHILRKLNKGDYQYVFLQHGVMYMVSLSSKTRKSFHKGGIMPLSTKIVVSSIEEAEHLIRHGKYDFDDLLITGLPKFDRCKRNTNSNKIVIMPTWRPWEYNTIKNNTDNSKYYQMIYKIFNTIPIEYRDNVIILPHPVFIEFVKNTELDKYIPKNPIYDEILRETSLLITDYSSIAYDAFYRGCNVIFWWQEKEYCMDKYQGFLMLNENNTFGDICYREKELKNAIIKNYKKDQFEKYQRRYRNIVEFHDSNNTVRLIEELKNLGII